MTHRRMWLVIGMAVAVGGCHTFGVQPDEARSRQLAQRERTVVEDQFVPIFNVANTGTEGSRTKTWQGPFIQEKDDLADVERQWFPWPLFQTERRGTSKSVSYPPVYWCHDDGGQGQEYIFPIFFRWRDGMQRTTFILPCFMQVDHLEADVGGRVRIAKSESWIWPLFNKTTEYKLVPVEEPED